MAEKPRRIGLLCVHGIGEQERWEHLTSTTSKLAELLRKHPDRRARVAIIDRTQSWDAPAGKPDISEPTLAPITIQYRASDGSEAIDFECHEVWWADLGKRRGLIQSFSFWLWGLGQWNAPIYASRDNSRLAEAPKKTGIPQVNLPTSTSAQRMPQILTRLSLAWAGVVASIIVFSLWGILRVVSVIAGKKISLGLIIDYLGDVEVYQERGQPGGGKISDPGQPARVAIRRRMVSEMVAMGAREYDSWGIFAHSLGSVLAFNGIGEIGHTLPNYCEKELWDALPAHLKTDDDCPKRRDIENMMPARPGWLSDEHCIDKQELFGNLTNFVTYGSPLSTFAAIWPRIVAFEKGVGARDIFANTRWLNITSRNDPVSGMLDRYRKWTKSDGGEWADGATDLPEAFDLTRPTYALYGQSHVAYFSPKVPSELVHGDKPSEYATFYDQLMKQVVRNPKDRPQLELPPGDAIKHDNQKLRSSALVTAIVFALCFLLLGGLIWAFGASLPSGFQFVEPAPGEKRLDLAWAIPGWGMFWLSFIMLAVYTAGMARNDTEMRRDLEETEYEIWRHQQQDNPNEVRLANLHTDQSIAKKSLWINRLLTVGSAALLAVIFLLTRKDLFDLSNLAQILSFIDRGTLQALRPLAPVSFLLMMFALNSAVQAQLSHWASRRKSDG